MRLIAFDPGEETGWATGTVEDGVLTITDHGWQRWWPCAIRYRRSMEADPYDETIFEGWRLTQKGARVTVGSDMPWSQFIGIMKLVAHDHGKPVIEQPPALKRVINTRMLPHKKWLPASEVEHNRDAIRHLVHRAVFEHGVKKIIKANGEEVIL